MRLRVRVIASLHDPTLTCCPHRHTLDAYRETASHRRSAVIIGPGNQPIPLLLNHFDGFAADRHLTIRAIIRAHTWDATPFPLLDPGDIVLSEYTIPADTITHHHAA